MSFEKRTYTAYETTITADNLNAMQDELIALREDKYEKPAGGMPKTDLASGVQTSLGKADTALQPTDVDSAMSDSSENPVQNKVIGATLKAGTQATAAWHLGFYLDANGDLCQVDN